MDPTQGLGYASARQQARRITEAWAEHNLFCVACTADSLRRAKDNRPVWDFQCSDCGSRYQLKSSKAPFKAKVANSAYEKKMEAITNGVVPHYAFLHYREHSWTALDLFVIPSHFISRRVIERRKPLPAGTHREGWVGSNILLGRIDHTARVNLLVRGVPRSSAEARAEWDRFRFVGEGEGAMGGWTADVLSCVHEMRRETGIEEFTLQDFYARFGSDLAALHPGNQNVTAKIRQQLQVLRDRNVLEFLEPGRYKLVA